MKTLKIIATLIIMLFSTLTAYSNTASVGSMWKQIDQTVSPADDVTNVTDVSFGSYSIEAAFDGFNDSVLNTSLSSGIDSHAAGSDTSGRVTRNTGDITKIDIEETSAHIQGTDYPFEAVIAVDPSFGVGENTRWIGYGTSGLVTQEGVFTDEQQRTIMPLARIQAVGGQSGPGSDISDVGILDHRYMISEDGYRWSIYLDNAIGSLFESGGLITENGTTDRDINISAGKLWDSNRVKQEWEGFQNVTGIHLNHVSGVWVGTSELLKMDNVNYDNGTDLTAMTNNNFYCSHTILMSPRGTQDAEFDKLRLFWVHCQSEWNSQQGAIDSGLDFGPFIDQATSGLVPLAQVIVKKNTANTISRIDVRPRIGTAGGSITTGTVTRQGAYNNGSDITLDAIQGGIVISDNATPVGDLFKINNFANTTSFFKVDNGRSETYGQSVAYKNVSSTNVAVAKIDYSFDCDASNGSVTFDMFSTSPGDKQPVYEFTVTDDTNKCFIDGNGAQTVTVGGKAFATYSGLSAIGKTLKLQGTGTGYITRSRSNGQNAAFKAHRNAASDQTISTGTGTKFQTTIEDYDKTGEYVVDADDSGGAAESRFTATLAGVYDFFATLRLNTWSGDIAHNFQLEFRVNGAQIGANVSRYSGTALWSMEHSISYNLAVGDYVELWIFHDTGSDKAVANSSRFSYWGGALRTE